LMGIFGLPNINIYKIDAELQAADIGAQRITCIRTWKSNCILVNLSEPGVCPTGQHALALSAKTRDS
jgi:hypothetical protein